PVVVTEGNSEGAVFVVVRSLHDGDDIKTRWRAQAQGVVCSGTCLSQGRNHIGCHQGSTQCQANNCPTFSYHCMSPELAEYSCFTLVRTQIETGLAILRKPRRNDPPRASSASMDGTGT